MRTDSCRLCKKKSDRECYYDKIIGDLQERSASANERNEELKGYSTEYYRGELRLSKTDSILFFVSDKDAAKINQLKNTSYVIVMDMYCEKLRSNLNAVLSANAYLKYLEDKNN